MSPEQEPVELTAAYLEGVADPETVAALDLRLRTDPTTARLLAAMASEQVHLADLHRPQARMAPLQLTAPRRWRWWWTLPLAAALLLGLFAGRWWCPPTPLATIQTAVDCEIRSGSGIAIPGPQTPLHGGEHIHTGPAGNALLVWRGEATTCALGPEAELLVDRGSAVRTLALDQGHLAFATAPHHLGGHFRVRTPHGLAELRAARCLLDVSAARTRLEVIAGSADLALPDGTKVPVQPGMVAEIGSGLAATFPAATVESRARIADGAGPFDWAGAAGNGIGRWSLLPDGVMQTDEQASAELRSAVYQLPLHGDPGACEITLRIQVDRVAPSSIMWGFGLIIGAQGGTFSVLDRSGLAGGRVLTLRNLDRSRAAFTGLRDTLARVRDGTQAALDHGPAGVYRLRVGIERATDGDRVRAKLWAEGDPEPPWQVQKSAGALGALRSVGLLTHHAACRFERLVLLHPERSRI